jgi:hypothetical protein
MLSSSIIKVKYQEFQGSAADPNIKVQKRESQEINHCLLYSREKIIDGNSDNFRSFPEKKFPTLNRSP